MKYHYVYRITNKELNKHYYGVRSSKIEPKLDIGIKYFSSSRDKDFINEQKVNNSIFKYKVIKIFETREEAINLEIKLHSKFDVGRNKSFYNRSKQTTKKFDTSGIHSWNKGLTKETNISIREMSNKKIGLKRTDEQKQKMSNSAKGKIPWNKGKNLSESHKQKIRDSSINYITEDYITKLKNAKIGYRPHNADKGLWVTPFGEFLSLNLAVEKSNDENLGFTHTMIRTRCKSLLEKYNVWYYKEF